MDDYKKHVAQSREFSRKIRKAESKTGRSAVKVQLKKLKNTIKKSGDNLDE